MYRLVERVLSFFRNKQAERDQEPGERSGKREPDSVFKPLRDGDVSSTLTASALHELRMKNMSG